MEIITKQSEAKIVFKTDLTGGEYQDIQDITMSAIQVTGEDSIQMQGSSLADVRNKKIETLVVSVNGETAGVLEKVRALPASDYNEVLAKVEELFNGLSNEKKTE